MYIASYEKLVQEGGINIPLEIDCEEQSQVIALSFKIPELKLRNLEDLGEGDRISVYRVEKDGSLTTSTLIRREVYKDDKWSLVENPTILPQRFRELLGGNRNA